ncbi:MAG TPA: serine protease [Polyangiaceae bacterium]|nr:serine protease [Polyangiaceae bacterium]
MPLRLAQNIDPFSLRALKLTPAAANGYPLTNATGFVVRRGGVAFVVTNVHVVTGKHSDTGAKLAANQPPPDLLTICCHVTEEMRIGHGVWTYRDERLVGEAIEPLWYEHPTKDLREWPHPETFDERVVDVAVLPLKETESVELYEVSLESEEPNVFIRPGLTVSIIGFPFGDSTGGYFPIWKTGHIASDFDRSANERYFLVDASTREGMSGSPVIFRPLGPYLGASGEVLVGDGDTSFFLGIYSGRIRPDADIGIVWRAKVIAEVLDHALRLMAAAGTAAQQAVEADGRASS